MNVYAYNVTAMGAMVKGKIPFDPAAFSHHAGELAAATRLDLLAGFPGFPEDSVNDESGQRHHLAWLGRVPAEERGSTRSIRQAG